MTTCMLNTLVPPVGTPTWGVSDMYSCSCASTSSLCMFCVLLPHMQLSARRRQLLQASGNSTNGTSGNSTVLYSVLFEVPALTTAPAEVVLKKVEASPCGIPGFCEAIGAPVVLSSSASSATVPVVANLTMALVSYSPGNLRVRATYLQNGASVNVPLTFGAVSGDPLSCTSSYTNEAWLYTCDVTLAQALTVVATGPNPSKPSQPLTASVTIPGW